jgi:dTDP-4-amino-4,6-dideoxygalactose transaminase
MRLLSGFLPKLLDQLTRMVSKSKRIYLSPPHLGGEELLFVEEAFESNYIAPVGPQVDAFEGEFCAKVGAKHAAAVASGTAALHLVLRLLGVGPDDEVWTSTLTFIGSVSPITYLPGTWTPAL